MSYTYLQEQEEGFLAECYSDTPQFALWKLNHIAEKSYCNASEMESCRDSQFGMTSELSTESSGKEKLTLFAADSHAKTLARQEKELELKASEAGFGARWQGWFAKLDRVTCSWKTPQCSLLADLDEFSETWPKWGIMQDGACLELATPEETICGSVSGFLPTVRRSGQSRAFKAYDRGENYRGNFEEFLGRIGFRGFILPQLSEALMMWPIGWTDIAPLETGKFQQWLRSHGGH